VHTVLVTGLILTPLCALWLLFAEGRTGLRHPLRLGPESEREQFRQRTRGWRLYYRVHRVERLSYGVGLVAGVLCLVVAGVASAVG
jgi:hypothetical protein